jgi:hypothetical protein
MANSLPLADNFFQVALVEDYDAAVADMKGPGFALVQSGRNGETKFAYFDTDGLIGTLTELVYLAPAERAGFERMKRKEKRDMTRGPPTPARRHAPACRRSNPSAPGTTRR